MSRAYSIEETQKLFIDHIKESINYWSIQPQDKKQCLEGLAFSILVLIDGDTNLPRFSLKPDPHPSDKDFSIRNGENWFDSRVELSGDLHDMFYEKDDNQ